MTSYLDIHYEHYLCNVELLYLIACVNDLLIVMYIIFHMMPL